MRSYAVIPPLILDAKQKRYVFHNENGALTDMENDFKVCTYYPYLNFPQAITIFMKYSNILMIYLCYSIHSSSTTGSEKFKRVDNRRKRDFQREISATSEELWRHCC